MMPLLIRLLMWAFSLLLASGFLHWFIRKIKGLPKFTIFHLIYLILLNLIVYSLIFLFIYLTQRHSSIVPPVEEITAIVNSLPPVISPVSIPELISDDSDFYTDTALIIVSVSVTVVVVTLWFYGVPIPFTK